MIKKIWYIGILMFMLAVGMTMESQASAKTTKEQDIMSIQLYLGQSIVLADLPEGEILLSRDHVIEISDKHIAKAIGKGTYFG